MAIGAEPGSMDPLLKSDGQRDAWSFSVLEGLTQRTNDIGVEGIAPLLAESWTVDGTSYLFNLRQGVKFHDGTDLTADDVVASYERMLQPDSELIDQFIAADTTVEKVDDYTVRIGRPTADPLIVGQASLIAIVPAEWAAQATLASPTQWSEPVHISSTGGTRARKSTCPSLPGTGVANQPSTAS